MNFKVIKGGKRNIDYTHIYNRLFYDKYINLYKNSTNKDYLKKFIYYGVKYIGSLKIEYEDLDLLLEVTELIKLALGVMTPKDMIEMFPIDKDFKGNKYGCKDYFYTKNELDKIGFDCLIEKNIENLLWDYMNKDINSFQANCLTIINHLYQRDYGRDILEEFLDEHNIPTYNLFEYDNKKYLYDRKNNNFTRIVEKIPKHLKLI